MKLLNKGDYFHTSQVDDACRYFVDNYSRVDTVPETALYDCLGNKIMTLETSDFSQLLANGYKFPEPFKVKAADGVTDLYGVMYKPFDFDSTKLYPIVDYVYPGPQVEATTYPYTRMSVRTDRLAQAGFIVITVGNRGGHPDRSKLRKVRSVPVTPPPVLPALPVPQQQHHGQSTARLSPQPADF